MILVFTLIIVAVLVYIIYNTSSSNKQQNDIAHSDSFAGDKQPIHFDLLDDNGDQINTVPSDSVAGNPNAPVQQLKYFCIKDKGYHVSVWPKDYDQFDVVEFSIAGISHRDGIDDYIGEFVGILQPEPTNPYDPNAIKVLAKDGHHVGYVPKDQTQYVRDFATLPCRCYCYIGTNDGMYFTDCYITRNDQ